MNTKIHENAAAWVAAFNADGKADALAFLDDAAEILRQVAAHAPRIRAGEGDVCGRVFTDGAELEPVFVGSGWRLAVKSYLPDSGLYPIGEDRDIKNIVSGESPSDFFQPIVFQDAAGNFFTDDGEQTDDPKKFYLFELPNQSPDVRAFHSGREALEFTIHNTKITCFGTPKKYLFRFSDGREYTIQYFNDSAAKEWAESCEFMEGEKPEVTRLP